MLARTLLVAAFLIISIRVEAAPSCRSKLTEPLTATAIETRVRDCDLRSVEDVLPLLPDSLLERYTLMFSGRGRQEASPENPRAILFGRDAKVVVAFNGHPSQRAHHDLEILAFDEKTKSFTLRAIQFSEDRSQAATFTGVNPQMCVMCHSRHTDTIRPYWDGYMLWPGAFGGEDDSLFRASMKDTSSADYKAWDRFQKNNRRTGRYATLKPLATGLVPNTELGVHLGKLNFATVANEIALDASLTRFHFALLGALACKDEVPVEDFIPFDARKNWQSSVASLEAETRKALGLNFSVRVGRLQSFYAGAPEQERIASLATSAASDVSSIAGAIDQPEVIARLRYVVENSSALRVGSWSMAPGKTSFVFADGVFGFYELQTQLVDALLEKQDPILWGKFQASGRVSTADLCQDLKAKSQAALSAPSGPLLPRPERSRLPIH